MSQQTIDTDLDAEMEEIVQDLAHTPLTAGDFDSAVSANAEMDHDSSDSSDTTIVPSSTSDQASKLIFAHK